MDIEPNRRTNSCSVAINPITALIVGFRVPGIILILLLQFILV